MDEFNNQNGVPNGNGEYHFVPPSQSQPNSGQMPNGNSTGYYNNANTPNNAQSYYQPSTGHSNKGYYQPQPGVVVNGKVVNANKHKKNNKALKIVIAIIVVCAVISIVGIAVSITRSVSFGENKENVTMSDDASASVNSSNEAAKTDKDGNYTVAGVAANNMDSCVLISVYSVPSTYDYFFGYGSSNNGSSNSARLSGEGSGVLMSEGNGKTYVMTCAHVIANGSSFKITTNDGKEYDANMVGYDSQTDIGVLSIDKTGFKIATFGDSKDIEVGEQCVAIGCPGGSKFMNSVATGIVSALDRPVASSIGYNTELYTNRYGNQSGQFGWSSV